MALSLFTATIVAATGGMLSSMQMSADQPEALIVANASEPTRPEDAALECLPDDATNILLRGVAEHTSTAGGYSHDITYYLFELTSQGQWEERVVSDFRGLCGLTYSTAWGQTLSEHVDMAVARQLRLQAYQMTAEELGGIDALRQIFMAPEEDHFSATSDVLPKLPPENLWALHQIGIYPPEDTYTIQEIEPYVPGQLSQW